MKYLFPNRRLAESFVATLSQEQRDDWLLDTCPEQYKGEDMFVVLSIPGSTVDTVVPADAIRIVDGSYENLLPSRFVEATDKLFQEGFEHHQQLETRRLAAVNKIWRITDAVYRGHRHAIPCDWFKANHTIQGGHPLVVAVSYDEYWAKLSEEKRLVRTKDLAVDFCRQSGSTGEFTECDPTTDVTYHISQETGKTHLLNLDLIGMGVNERLAQEQKVPLSAL